jgi:predicted GNAT family N-acyltransferase
MIVVEEIPDSKLLDLVGRLRVEVWRDEGTLNEALFPQGSWIEPMDHRSRHWVARNESGELVAAARLSVHATLEDNPDGYLWKRAGREVPLPAAHFCKLVVRKDARGHGLGRKLNEIRLQASREMGAKSILVTASAKNSRLLLPLGFKDTGIFEVFENRPGFPFHALECILT